MMRLLLPLVLIIVAVGGYFKFTTPILDDIDTLRAERGVLNTALDNAKKLREAQEALLLSYRELPPADLARLDKFLPDNVDNVRLIIDINNIARQSGMSIKNLRLNSEEGESEASLIEGDQTGGNSAELGTASLGFSVTGSYSNFQSFLRDLAKSLRLVDVDTTVINSGALGDSYTYNVDIKTYWLK